MSEAEITTLRARVGPRTCSLNGHGLDALLAKAQEELRRPHNLFGYVHWASLVAGYQKALGLPIDKFQAYLDGRVFDFSTVTFKPGDRVELKMRKMTRKEKAELQVRREASGKAGLPGRR